MCGFFVSNDPNIKENNLSTIRKRLSFRGPDGESGLVEFLGWKLFHSRLAIIAPDNSFNQPYLSSDGSMIVFNGEILNYKALASKYNIKNAKSDTDVLSKILAIKDFDLNEIDGFFAFVRIDRNGILTNCARDRFGVKPLNYYKKNNIISISSEASCISDLYNLHYNKLAIEEYKVFRAPIFQGSYFEEIVQVKPGSCLVNGKYFESVDYIQSEYINNKDILGYLDEAIVSSINSRMVSDVPVGLLFSGGIDSNIINEYTNQKLLRFTGGFDGDFDVNYSKNHKMSSNLVIIDNDIFKERFYSMINLRKEPLSVPNEVILSLLGNKSSELGCKVLLSGECADEFFAGYDRIYQWAYATENFNVETFLKYYAYVDINDIPKRLIEETSYFFDQLHPLSAFEKVRQFFIKIHLPVLFRRLDFSLMYSGIEGREPLASYDLFKISMKINPENLFKYKLGKFPLRKLMSDKISHEFAFSPKVGFPIDLSKIFNNKKSESVKSNYRLWQKINLEHL